jgi:serine protease Do
VPVRPGEDQNSWDRDEDEKKLAQPQTAVVIGPRRVLVLSALSPSQTARLDKVRLTLADASVIDATFVGSADEYGALVVDPGRELNSPVVVIGTPWEALRDRLLLTADIRMTGDERTIQCGHLRLTTVQPGYKGRSVPSFAQGIESTFVFDTEGRLVGLPMARRMKAKQNRWEGAAVSIVAAAETVRFNGDAAGWADARNRPLTEAESRQLAWLGVDLQPLDTELALTHAVSAQTEDGDHGALVTYVYAGSPAAKAGLKAGDVVLRVQPEGASKPVEIKVEQHAFSDQPFPWDRYDQINETYYDRIPPPWMPAEDSLNRQLKDFGTGTPYRLDYARGGRVASLNLKVEAGPVHYMTASEGSRDGLGFRVRELTFETRRYYQLADEAAALIVARVEAGGAASTAGLKPYELITTINEQPVGSVADFDRMVDTGGVLRFGVKRMSQGRVVILDAGAKMEAGVGGK